jgi:rhodanese-related sulfurtransferase
MKMFPVRQNSDPYFDNAEKLAELMASGTEFVLVDTRTREEWDEGYLPGAIHIPYEEIGDRPPTTDKKAMIVVYCHSGVRSETAKQTLRDLGYEQVYNFGGIVHWPGDLVGGHE